MPNPQPPASASIHGPFLEQSIPDWLINATPERRATLKEARTTAPDWYTRATPAQRLALNNRVLASFNAQTALDKAVASLQSVDQFAEPLLRKALQDQFNLQLDVNTTYLHLQKPVELGVFAVEVDRFDVLKLPLLQAALHNFEEAEAKPGAFHRQSGFLRETQTPGTFDPITTALTVPQFIHLCRTLDIGALYQAYLERFLKPQDDQALRQAFIAAQKAALSVAADQALLQQDIRPADYRMIQDVINGERHPRLGGKPVWFRDLGMMKKRLTGCVVFVMSEQYRYSDELILYIPNDPLHPLKRYTFEGMRAAFKQHFTARDNAAEANGNPTGYQRFFSQFVDYADRPYFFSQFTENAPAASLGEALQPYAPLANQGLKGINPFILLVAPRELPPAPPRPKVANLDPYIDATALSRKGHGIWAENIDLWTYLFEQYRDKLINDARSHAVPTADVDARVRSEKFSALLNIGLLVLNAVSMFVPVLGEVMMVVMAGQLLHETFTGVIEWSEGDRRAAKAHLIDVAENLAVLALMVAGGKALAKLTAAKAEPVIENLHPVSLPDGQVRLGKADLRGYESPVLLEGSPNAQGQYFKGGKTYIRQGDKAYEQRYDATVQRWRIAHPSDASAYQPLLSHNGQGAWRHSLERPLAWDRLTLLRRMGHSTQGFTDAQLLKAADISGVTDNQLRRMHMDNRSPAPELTDAMRLIEADQGVDQVIEQIRTGQSTNGRYLFTLPLITELPRWPLGRVLEVFDSRALTGRSIKYGSERWFAGIEAKAPIRISRADVLSGELPTRILAALNETEITTLLGGEPARVVAERPTEFRKQIADFARTRQAAIFESLYNGHAASHPDIAKLQRLCPGLSEPAARNVIELADAEQLARLHSTGRMPLPLLEQGRWYARQGRLGHAYAGLHLENMAAGDSTRLALHALQRLPGWSDQLRLEVREGSISGALLDGIGSETAPQRKYLVKHGPVYQAFNARGESLNSLPRHGDNFYASIMHALPDEARQALGMPQVSQSADLRRAIIDYALGHRGEMAARLDRHAATRQRIKAPTRISASQVGYLASGRGSGVDPSLVSRVQDLYPQLTEQQANGFILEQRLAGQSDAQIYGLLQARTREWQSLEASLDQWGGPQPQGLQSSSFGSRAVADSIKDSWRNAPLAGEDPRYAQLRIIHFSLLPPLPRLSADFSHVRDLQLVTSSADDLLALFPNLEKLHMAGSSDQLDSVFERVRNLRQLRSLSISVPLTPPILSRLGTLTHIEELSLVSARFDGPALPSPPLDVSAFNHLRRLEIIDPWMKLWPTGVLDLPALERLNLRQTAIDALPGGIYDGHERLFAGLSLDWSRFPREVFKPAYEFVSSRAEHLMDLEEMVSDYCRGELKRLTEMGPQSPDILFTRFAEQWPGAETRFAAIEALSAQCREINGLLEAWVGDSMTLEGGGYARSTLASTLRTCWRNGVYRQYGSSTGEPSLDRLYGHMSDSSVLDLPYMQLDTLPHLPAAGFTHVRTLRMRNLRVPADQVQVFIRAFPSVQMLDLSGSALTQLPFETRDLPALEHLNLRNNPLHSLDVRGLERLQSLSLRGTTLTAWPTGVEHLSQLTWLDLRSSQLTRVPASALAQERVLLNANLTDTPLTPEAHTALKTAMHRVEQARGLPEGTLQRFAENQVPDHFPPAESGGAIARHLLPLLPAEIQGASLEQRLHRLCPALDEDGAAQWLAKLREDGVGDAQLHQRVDAWNRDFEDLTRRLNGWMYLRETRGIDWTRGGNWILSAQSRGMAARRIMACWRDGILAWSREADSVLTLNGLQLGDLPPLPVSLAHVGTLDLSGVRVTELGSNGFLSAFPQLHVLELSGNGLQLLPAPVGAMSQLERLELGSNSLADPEPLYRTLANLTQLQWLDLSYNNLETFSVDNLHTLHTLDLRNNRLVQWPDGVLTAPNLRSLNLSDNEISLIPDHALNGQHDTLLDGVDLSDNVSLSLDSLERLRDYLVAGRRDRALGLTRSDIEQLLHDLDSDTEDANGNSGVEEDEDIVEAQGESPQRAAWLENIDPDAVQGHIELWEQLHAEPDNQAFFHLLARLQDTLEFRVARADLTRRVWDVVSAAAGNSQLREILFAMANTHGTCIDGRILTFSGIEVKVYEYNALLGLDPERLDLKGQALLNLSRQLFRLGRVEALATTEGSVDMAERRLEYRIGLTDGWPDGLVLPAQPRHMSYGRPIAGELLNEARAEILRLEGTDAFYEDLISRDYWVQYLTERYPDEFNTLSQITTRRRSSLEAAHEQIDEAYGEAANALEIELSTQRNQKLIELSRRETGA